MRAVKKEFYVEIRKTKSRFISILIIVALGVAFFAGICSTEPDMRLSADKLYDDGKLMDIRVVSPMIVTEGGVTGINDEIVKEIGQIDGVKTARGAYLVDFINRIGDKEGVVSLQSYTEGINEPAMKEGRLPEEINECIVEKSYAKNYNLKIGDELTFTSGNETAIESIIKETTFTVTGIYTSPYYIGRDRGTTTIGNGKIDGVAMVREEAFLLPVYGSCYITVEGAEEKEAYTDEYNETVEVVKNKIETYVNGLDGVWYVLDRMSIQTYGEFDQDAQRIGNIGKVIPVVFFIVAALVSLTTMTRMVEEQRTQIGTLKALGYTKAEVASKYIKYALFASVIGSLIGGIFGSLVLPRVIINAYNMLYTIETILTPVNMFYFTLACGVAVILVTVATVFSCYRELTDCPAALMRPEPPKKTKKIFLEHIPVIWNKINFGGKSTIRNLVRYKKRLFMTLFGISGCMSLLVVGFGVKDSINSIIGIQYDELHRYDTVLGLEAGLSDSDRENIESKLNNNREVRDYIFIRNSSLTLEGDEASLTGFIYVANDTEKFTDFIKLRDREKHENYQMSDSRVMISEKAADKLKVNKGDTIKLVFGDTDRYEAVVGDIVENYVYHNVYMTQSMYEGLVGKAEYNQILISLTDKGKENEEKIIEELLRCSGVSGVSYIDKMRSGFEDMLGSMDVIIAVIIIAAGGLAFIVLYNLNNINISERRRELATLKVLGFYDIEVSRYIYRENVILTIIGIVAGAFLGVVLHRFVIVTAEVDMVMFGRSVEPLSFVWSSLLTILFAVIINISMHSKLKKVDMATSLKSVE